MKLLIRFSSWCTKPNHGHSRFAKRSIHQKLEYPTVEVPMGIYPIVSEITNQYTKYHIEFYYVCNVQIKHKYHTTLLRHNLSPFQIFFLNLAKYRVHPSAPFHTHKIHSSTQLGILDHHCTRK